MNPRGLDDEDLREVFRDLEKLPKLAIAQRCGINIRSLGKIIERVRKAGGLDSFLRSKSRRLWRERSTRNLRERWRANAGPGIKETWTSILHGARKRPVSETIEIPKL